MPQREASHCHQQLIRSLDRRPRNATASAKPSMRSAPNIGTSTRQRSSKSGYWSTGERLKVGVGAADARNPGSGCSDGHVGARNSGSRYCDAPVGITPRSVGVSIAENWLYRYQKSGANAPLALAPPYRGGPVGVSSTLQPTVNNAQPHAVTGIGSAGVEQLRRAPRRPESTCHWR
jgi:hypothetical protein